MPLAVKAGAVSLPLAPVVPVKLRLPPAKVPPAPLAGAVKLTVAPPTGLLLASRTVASRATAKVVLMAVLCPLPAEADRPALLPAVLVREKLAGPAAPAPVAVIM